MIREAYLPSSGLLTLFTEHRIQFDDGHHLSMSNILIVLLFALVSSAVSQRGEFSTRLYVEPTLYLVRRKLSDMHKIAAQVTPYRLASSVIPGRQRQGKAIITPEGPHMRIDLSWKDRRRCRNGREPLYDIIHYDEKRRSTAIETKYSKSSLTIESPIPSLGPLNILFWSRHEIRVSADCPYRHHVDQFIINEPGGESPNHLS